MSDQGVPCPHYTQNRCLVKTKTRSKSTSGLILRIAGITWFLRSAKYFLPFKGPSMMNGSIILSPRTPVHILNLWAYCLCKANVRCSFSDQYLVSCGLWRPWWYLSENRIFLMSSLTLFTLFVRSKHIHKRLFDKCHPSKFSIVKIFLRNFWFIRV